MTKNVLVSISGLQTAVDEKETIEVINRGEYYFRGGKHYIRYEENTDEATNTMDTRCMMKISGTQLEIVKKGDVSTRMLFEKGATTISSYSTPIGELTVGITTQSVRVTESDHELSAELFYSLDVNCNLVAECHLTIRVSDSPETIL